MGVFLYHSTGQVGPSLGGTSGSPNGVETMQLHHSWGWHPIQTDSHIYMRYIHSVWTFSMLSQGHMGAPLSFYQPSWSYIWEFWFTCGVEMMPLRHGWGWHPPQTSFFIHIQYIQIGWAFVCCVKGMWVHRNTIPPAKLAPELGRLGCLCSGNDTITSCLWLPWSFNSNCFPSPY